MKIILEDGYMKRQKKFWPLKDITSLVWPIYLGKDIFDVLENTNLLEGDVIRFFRQILDRIGQILKATHDAELTQMLENIKNKIIVSLKEIDAI